ncbi:MAG: DinB family protein [Cytophagales bacterium]|nr:MAG: DinB family protein [Cytophagales bacterium]
MTQVEALRKEMEQEAVTTHKMLERIPDDRLDWQPHSKSMTIRQLATHIAEIPTWTPMTFTTDGIDFEQMDYNPTVVNSTAELVALHQKSLQAGLAALATATDDQLDPIWTMRSGDVIHSQETKGESIRMAFCQTVHHRAQLGVYLRLLDIPIPGSYGPSADEPWV